jgi:hypothetical protein
MAEIFRDKAFGVEHALIMYAKSYVTMPAFGIYENKFISPLLEQIRHCHIYIIGLTPKQNFVGAAQEAQELVTSFEIGGKRYDLRWPLPEGAILKGNDQDGFFVEDKLGARYFPSETAMAHRLSAEYEAVDFKVLYIGQSFGESGSRNALDRLKKHETLQKIAVTGIPDGYNLTILMLAIEAENRLVTIFNPWGKDKNQSSERIKKGLDKLFGTNEAERTTLYEASLIRYFQPKFNIEFKKSFPSTNMKLLAECYDKDFSALVAEISIDELPFRLFSEKVERKFSHMAMHDLHTDESRRVFFA